MSLLHCPRLFVFFGNKLIFYGKELLAPRPTPNSEDQPMSAVRDCLFNIFAAQMDLRDIGRDGMDWIDMAQDRDQWRVLVNTVLKLRVPLNAGEFLSACTIGGFARRGQFRE
jgi:hypothetical protein